jgi:hypothetical protein
MWKLNLTRLGKLTSERSLAGKSSKTPSRSNSDVRVVVPLATMILIQTHGHYIVKLFKTDSPKQLEA